MLPKPICHFAEPFVDEPECQQIFFGTSISDANLLLKHIQMKQKLFDNRC
jgi:hypothetical protein